MTREAEVSRSGTYRTDQVTARPFSGSGLDVIALDSNRGTSQYEPAGDSSV